MGITKIEIDLDSVIDKLLEGKAVVHGSLLPGISCRQSIWFADEPPIAHP